MIINGRQLAREFRKGLKEEVSKLNTKPRLDILWLEGENQEATEIYVNQKKSFADKVGVYVKIHRIEEEQQNIEYMSEKIFELNSNKDVDGIIIQIPVPDQRLLLVLRELIDVTKDVDGMHPYNSGGFHLNILDRHFISPTALAVYEILNSIKYEFKGKKAVVVGNGMIAGSPISQLLLAKQMTVAVCHEETEPHDLISECRSANLLVAAAGSPELIKDDWVRDEAVVIDVGINRDLEGNIVGDVDFHNVRQKASYITPVPKGVGPVTVAMLIGNVVKSHIRFNK